MSLNTLRRRHAPHLNLQNARPYGEDGGGSDDEFEVDSSIPSTPFDGHGDEQYDRLVPDTGKRASRSPSFERDRTDSSSKGALAPETSSELDDRQCRICFGGPEEEESLGKMISPCLCTGSMRVS